MRRSKSANKSVPYDPQFRAVLDRISRGEEVADREFDEYLPAAARAYAKIHWTSIGVARRAAELLVTDNHMRILDIGSGVGKFCLIGSLTTRGYFTGIERSSSLVAMAKALVQSGSVGRTTFLCADALELDWQPWDAYYLFNPFAAWFEPTTKGVAVKNIAGERQAAMVSRALERLDGARPGTRAAIYWGVGGNLPDSWAQEHCEPMGSGALELWVKR